MKKIVLALASVLFMVSCAESPKVSDQKVYYLVLLLVLTSTITSTLFFAATMSSSKCPFRQLR